MKFEGRKNPSRKYVCVCVCNQASFSLFFLIWAHLSVLLSSLPSSCFFIVLRSAHPLKSLYAFIAASLRSNISVLIVLKCNQGVWRGAANNLNLTEHLRQPSARPSSPLPKRTRYISVCAEDIFSQLQAAIVGAFK